MPKYYQLSAWLVSAWLERGFCSKRGSRLESAPAGTQCHGWHLDHSNEWPPNAAHSGMESHIPWNVIHDDLLR
jgi:hypothetical protein